MKRITFEIDYSCCYPIAELIDYLKSLDGIKKVSYNYEKVCPLIDVTYDDSKISYKTIFYETCAFSEMSYEGSILSFDQHLGKEAKSYELNFDGLDCDLCYRSMIETLFSTNGIISMINCYGDYWKNQPSKVRIKVYYDDKIISLKEIKELENKIRSDFC